MYKEATKIVSLDSRRWKILFRYIKFSSGYCLFITSDFIYFIQHPRKIKKWDKFRFFNFPCKSLNNKNMSMVNVAIYGGWFASCFCYVCMDSIIEFSNFMFVSVLARRVVWFTVGRTAHGWANYQLNLSIKLRFFKILNKLWGGM